MPSLPSLTIGYAAMLEQFHPTEAIELSRVRRGPRLHAASWRRTTSSRGFPRRGSRRSCGTCWPRWASGRAGDIGPGVTAPTFRWHPAMVAQASATLAAMYPGRHWLGIGSGEALNEHVVAQYWPEAPERINRMFEAVDIIKKLFTASLAGKDVKHAGQFYKLESTRLWTMPDGAPGDPRRDGGAGHREARRQARPTA